MMAWTIFLLTGIVETFVSLFFYNIFLKQRFGRVQRIIGYVVLYALDIINAMVMEALPNRYIPLKFITLIAFHILYLRIFSLSDWIVSVYFATLNNTLFALFGSIVFNILEYTYLADHTVGNLWEFGICIIWIGILSILRKNIQSIKPNLMNSTRIAMHFGLFPVLSLIAGLYYYHLFLQGIVGGLFGTLVAAGLVIVNIVSIFMLQESLVKDEKLRLLEIQNESKQNQLQAFHDMQSLYELQGQKLHDYKKQLSTLQELMKSGDIDTAIELTEQLTKSIAVETSEINVGHPVINAVLNQQYRVAKGKNIGMTFAVSEPKDVRLADDDIVVLLGNLLENAIHECEKVTAQGRVASISVKFVEASGKVILNVRNPVREKVEIVDNKVATLSHEGHGIGLSNVESVSERNGGTFAISCDDNEFVAVVII